jgi:integrase/recombinase XerD
MKKTETNRFNKLYQRHLRSLKLQGKSKKTIEAYSRAVRRIAEYFDCCPDKLSLEQREQYFADLVKSHSWSTVKIDRIGLQFFWKHVLKQNWQWVDIVKAPKVRSLPDILTIAEVEQLIGATRKLRYRVFMLATYSMGLRLSEALALQVGDIDAQRKQVHIRRGKGHKDRFVPLSDLSGIAYLVAQTSKSLLVVSKCRGLTRAYSKSHHAHGSRRHSGGHESRGRQVWH